MKRFTEDDVEKAALEWFSELGYSIKFGPNITEGGPHPERSYSQVVLIYRLRNALVKINPNLPPEAIEETISKLTVTQSPNLYSNNHTFHRMLTDGITLEVKSKDGKIRHEQVWPIDFQNPENNEFLAVNQFTIVENQDRRPDIVIFINGLPLGVIELKNPADPNATIEKAFNQLQTYKKDIPSLFTTNEVLIASDGGTARIGSLTADWERFMPWRAIEGTKEEPKGKPDLETMLKGVFGKKRFLDLVRNFVVFNVDGSEIIKKVAGYHQFHAVNVGVKKTIAASSAKGDRKVGVIWHTQGSGKSLTMAFYAGKIIQLPEMENPTIIVITDRNDLDNQLYDEFSRSHELLRQQPRQAESRKHLRELLKVASGGVIFTTIQKFVPEKEEEKFRTLSARRNIVVIADEAHRSQYDFIDGFARHLHDSLPNASMIGFTATPLELSDRSTIQIFGNYIDIYDIQRSIEDNFTVPIYYEARMAKLALKDKERPKIDKSFEEITEQEEARVRERLKSKWGKLEAVVGAHNRIRKVAEDIIDHFEQRTAVLEGKAMIVCMSRRICVELYDEIIKLRPEWHSDSDDKGEIKVVMTGSASDNKRLQPHIRNKVRRESIKQRFKNPDDPLKLVIVRDMWLTGFDAPVLHTMYVDKPMQGHGLMQSIARVNRVFKDKPGGLIVDYIGIGADLKEALSHYAKTDRNEVGIDEEQAIATMVEKYEICKNLFYKFDYAKFFGGKPTEQMSIISGATEHVLELEDGKNRFLKAVMNLSRSFALAVPSAKALEIRDELGFFQTIRSQIVKNMVVSGSGKSSEDIDSAIRQVVSKAIGARGVIDIFEAAGLKKPEMSPLMSEQFLESLKNLKEKNLALELLRKLINDELKLRLRNNLVQSRQFSDMLENSIRKYQNRTVDAAKIITELIQLAKDIKASSRRGEELHLNDDELAFYDALGVNDSAVSVLGDKTLRQIALELVDIVRNNATIDWTVRENVRARLRSSVRRILRKYGYPPDKQEKATQTVLEQAELLAKDWTSGPSRSNEHQPKYSLK